MALMIPPRVAKELAAMPRHDARRLLERLERIAAARKREMRTSFLWWDDQAPSGRVKAIGAPYS